MLITCKSPRKTEALFSEAMFEDLEHFHLEFQEIGPASIVSQLAWRKSVADGPILNRNHKPETEMGREIDDDELT